MKPFGLLLLFSVPCGLHGESASPLAGLPVREVTVFKDGHAFVLHSGNLATDPAGNARIEGLPTPVLGTFWPYSTQRDAKLVSVTAGQAKVKAERPAVTVAELLEANPGADVEVVQTNGTRYSATVLATPRRPAPPPPSPSPATEPERKPSDEYAYYGYGYRREPPPPPRTPYPKETAAEKPVTVLFKTREGVTAVPLALIQTVTFKGDHRRTLPDEGFRNELELKMDWADRRPRRQVEAGVVYLQKGIRWIPSYRVSLDGKGTGTLQLQATILNELVDLKDATINLVVGVPTFFFRDSPDPISLQQSFPALSKYFHPDSETGIAFSSALMGMGGMGGFGGGMGGGGIRCDGGLEEEQNQGADALTADRNEDLYVFTLQRVSLKKGQSSVVPVAEYRVNYRDMFVVEVPFTPPPEVERNQNRQQEAELAKLLREPRAQHRIRITNSATQPLTTAPALIVGGGRAIAQTLLPYAAPGSDVDLTVTTSGDFKVERTEKVVSRTAADFTESITKVSLEGKLTARSFRSAPSELEVIRYVPGRVDRTNPEGKVETVNRFDDGPYVRRDEYSSWWWWDWYHWPYWWDRYNRLSKITWKVPIQPNQTVELDYVWHYYWR